MQTGASVKEASEARGIDRPAEPSEVGRARLRRAILRRVPHTQAFADRIRPAISARIARNRQRVTSVVALDAATKARLDAPATHLFELEAEAWEAEDALLNDLFWCAIVLNGLVLLITQIIALFFSGLLV